LLPPVATLSADRRSVTERQNAILDAFERCIVGAGCHRTTMQDVAREAGMSAGNLYRYFASKDQLVSGLCERDRDRYGGEFIRVGEAENVMEELLVLGHRHFVEKPRSCCVQFMEIRAEATRNPVVAEICATVESEVHGLLVGVIEAAKRAGQVPPQVDSSALISIVSALGDGLLMRRTLDPDFDPEEGFRHLVAVMNAIIAGAVDLDAALPKTTPAAPPAPVQDKALATQGS